MKMIGVGGGNRSLWSRLSKGWSRVGTGWSWRDEGWSRVGTGWSRRDEGWSRRDERWRRRGERWRRRDTGWRRPGWGLFGALVLTGSLFGQDFSKIQVEKAAAGYRFTEGPVYSRDGFLLFSDVPNNKILKLTPGEGISLFRENSNGANGNTFDAQGRLLTCESRSRRVTRTDKKGHIEVLAERWEGKRLNAPNDIVARRDGHIYFTDPAFGNQADTRELDFYGIYHISPKGELRLIAKTEGRPNGIALSPNGRILYVSISDDRSIRAFDVDRSGAASNEREFISGIEGPPDGIRVDERGNLYVTAKSLTVYSPQGKLVHTIEIAETPRNCAFGDPDFQTLYITAMTSIYRIRLDVKGAVQY